VVGPAVPSVGRRVVVPAFQLFDSHLERLQRVLLSVEEFLLMLDYRLLFFDRLDEDRRRTIRERSERGAPPHYAGVITSASSGRDWIVCPQSGHSYSSEAGWTWRIQSPLMRLSCSQFGQ
jgi:hypothetical protein